MKHELSVLIPTYNHACTLLVKGICRQAEQLISDFEVIVAEDGSTDAEALQANAPLAHMDHCRYLPRQHNVGRAAIRNVLAKEARYQWLLFIDCDMTVCRPDFIRQYLECACETVIDGGVSIGGNADELKNNLRYRYEKAAEEQHTVQRRQQSPYRDLHTANLLVHHDIMQQYPFDERFRHYGYEDVLLGKQLKKAAIPIAHIDNPLGFYTFEENREFVSKTEEGLRTLHRFRQELRGYSTLLTLVEGIHLKPVIWLIQLWHLLFGRLERCILCGRHPHLKIFNLYKLGYYLTIKN